ncbi:terminase family protein [Campylobacter armoricus]|uniref:Terminase domain-containing protein n=1 Tax=Campylobacter armoricus TaxID=2505970 RepID=A0A7L5I096_9BACT|nr:terminase family protein [Campylobacter armoricus]QKF79551.1 terminase domain-containing protein [Campylobacter armoricus]
MNLKLDFSYTKAQLQVFNEKNPRFVTVAKGRRLGFTRGSAKYVIESLLMGLNVLWVDTIQANLQNYFELYFMPELKKLPKEFYSWSVQDKKLILNNAVLHMRSAERPENIEGFGYDLVILNEAGIILKDAKGEYLWHYAIRPMLLDNPKSRAIIGGVPKGKNLFYELCKKELSDKNFKHFQFSSYDNPFLSKEQIKELIEEVGGEDSEVVRQEIYGEFIDNSNNELFSLNEIEASMNLCSFDMQKMQGDNIWGLDVARYGDDKSVLAKRKGFVVDEIKKYSGLSTTALANVILAEFNQDNQKPQGIFIDTCGLGVGVYDVLHSYGLPVFEANSTNSATSNEYLNKRAQMYFTFAKNLKHMQIIKDDELKKDLRMIEYEYNDKGLLKIISKEQIKKNYGKSPDVSDAVALTFFERLHSRANTSEDWSYDGW